MCVLQYDKAHFTNSHPRKAQGEAILLQCAEAGKVVYIDQCCLIRPCLVSGVLFVVFAPVDTELPRTANVPKKLANKWVMQGQAT